MPLAFSQSWAHSWCKALNDSGTYREVASTWEGAVALVARTVLAEPVGVYLDLHHGECRGARIATDDDLATAAYVLEAPAAVWRELLEGRGSPVMALMTGRLSLARGELVALLPYASAARELLTLATQVETSFPADW
jgi:putative sterol carrier protein